MASEIGQSNTFIVKVDERSALARLFQHPYQFSFFQAVRLLNAAQARGLTGASNNEFVTYCTKLSLETPASPIHSLQYADAKAPIMTVTFMGLTGSAGALPIAYTEMLLKRQYRYKDYAAHSFFDLFNHRLLTLYYQAWQKHHIFVDYEQGFRNGFQQHVLSLIGMGTPGLQGRLHKAGIDDQALIYYSGLFIQRHRSVEDLTALLMDYFGIKVHIQQFRSHWHALDTADCTRLGHSHCTLGEYPMLGRQVLDCQSQFRIQVGPLKRQQFYDFLPTGQAYAALVKLVGYCIGSALGFDVQLILEPREVPSSSLTSEGLGMRLGWTSWLNWPQSVVNDLDKVILQEQPVG